MRNTQYGTSRRTNRAPSFRGTRDLKFTEEEMRAIRDAEDALGYRPGQQNAAPPQIDFAELFAELLAGLFEAILHGVFALMRAVLAVLLVGAVLVAVVVAIGAVSHSAPSDTRVQAPLAQSAVQYPDLASEPLVASDNAANIQELPLVAPKLPAAEIEAPAEAATETAPQPDLSPSVASPSLASPVETPAEADIEPQPDPEPVLKDPPEGVAAGPEIQTVAPVYQAPHADGVARRGWPKPGPVRFPRQAQMTVRWTTRRRFFPRVLRGIASLSAGTGVVVLSDRRFSGRQWDYGRPRTAARFAPLRAERR